MSDQSPSHPTRVNPVVRFAVERRVTMAMAVLGVMVLGWLSLTRLPLEFLPTFTWETITVEAPYPSSSPAETERLIVRPLEDSLGTISGIQSLTASATAQRGSVWVGFKPGTNMDLAAVEVRDRVDRVRGLLPNEIPQDHGRQAAQEKGKLLAREIEKRAGEQAARFRVSVPLLLEGKESHLRVLVGLRQGVGADSHDRPDHREAHGQHVRRARGVGAREVRDPVRA